MKITQVETFLLRCDVDVPFTSARGWWYKTKNAMLVKVSTDEGITGWGEAYGPGDVTRTIVDRLLAPLAIGSDPFAVDVLWEKMYQKVEDYCPRGFGVAAISAIDIALWDIMGKAVGRPVYMLLGGAHRQAVQAYATGLYFTKEHGDHTAGAVEEALHYKEQGFAGVKMKIALPPRQELARVTAVREALGPDVDLMVDANHGYSLSTALRLGREFEQMGLTWFEEPISPNDLQGYAELSRALDIPVAGGENAFTRYSFREILEQRAMDIVQPDLCCAGGITESRKIAALAQAFSVELVPHVWGSAVGLFAALHFMAALPDCPTTWQPAPLWMEYEQTHNPFRDELAHEQLRLEHGLVAIPDGPGLGLTIDERVIARYRVG